MPWKIKGITLECYFYLFIMFWILDKLKGKFRISVEAWISPSVTCWGDPEKRSWLCTACLPSIPPHLKSLLLVISLVLSLVSRLLFHVYSLPFLLIWKYCRKMSPKRGWNWSTPRWRTSWVRQRSHSPTPFARLSEISPNMSISPLSSDRVLHRCWIEWLAAGGLSCGTDSELIWFARNAYE